MLITFVVGEYWDVIAIYIKRPTIVSVETVLSLRSMSDGLCMPSLGSWIAVKNGISPVSILLVVTNRKSQDCLLILISSLMYLHSH